MAIRTMAISLLNFLFFRSLFFFVEREKRDKEKVLFPPQRVYGVQPGGLHRRHRAEEESHHKGEDHRGGHDIPADEDGHAGDPAHHVRKADAHQDAQDAADAGEHPRLREELTGDLPFAGPPGPS